MMESRIEKFFTAADTNEDRASQYGPFKTSGEAETSARLMEWGWVCVHTVTVRGDVVIDSKERFYQVPDELDTLRRKIVRGNEALVPMNENERTFFDRYEADVQKGVEEIATKKAGWTVDSRMSAALRRARS